MNDLKHTVTASFSKVVAQPSNVARAFLVAVRGEGGVAGVYPLASGGSTRIGRSSSCTIELAEAGVSREHATIERRREGWLLTDLGSKNGTHVNEARVGTHLLKDGDRIRVGDAMVLYFWDPGDDQREQQQALASARVGAWTWAPATETLTWSQAIDSMLDLPAGTLSGHDRLDEVVVAEDQIMVRTALERACATQGPVDLEFRVRPPSGETKWICVKGGWSTDRTGARLAGAVMDVTRQRQRQREHELRHQAAIFHSFSDAVVLLDLAGHVVDWNPSAVRSFGRERDAALGKRLFSLIDPGSALDSLMLLTLESKGSWALEHEFTGAGGQRCFGEFSAVPLKSSSGPPLGYVVIQRDVTQRKLLQDKLVVADRMAALGTLSAGVAHEINNPLAFISANLEFLADELAKLPDATSELFEAVSESRAGVQRIAKIVNDLRLLARNAENDPLKPVQLEAAIDAACTMATHLTRQRAQVHKQISTSAPVLASESKLAQVVLNLLVNAAQAITPGQAKQNHISMTLREEGLDVVLEVADTGCGMSPELQARAFDPFFTTKAVGTGTGLGLSISQGIVADLGGTLKVLRSAPNQGTTFELRLPRAWPSGEAVRGRVVLPEAADRPGRVLIIDDDKVLGVALARSLKAHRVEVVNDGHAALERLQAEPGAFDVVLCDLMMSPMSGDELFAAVKKLLPDVALRFVFMTGGACTEAAEQFLREATMPVLSKPVDLHEVRELVRLAVRGRSPAG